MFYKLLSLVRASQAGDIRRADIIKYIYASRIIRKLAIFDTTQEVAETNAFSSDEYKEMQNLLNIYLNINNTYDGFNYN